MDEASLGRLHQAAVIASTKLGLFGAHAFYPGCLPDGGARGNVILREGPASLVFLLLIILKNLCVYI